MQLSKRAPLNHFGDVPLYVAVPAPVPAELPESGIQIRAASPASCAI
jgi:hypothetical protein